VIPVFARLSKLGDTPESALEGAAARLAERGVPTRIELRLLDREQQHAAGKSGDQRLRVITRSDVWHEIAAGRLSPYEAFASGRLRFRGTSDQALQILRALRAPGGRLAHCVED
jgi:hypothetical protein